MADGERGDVVDHVPGLVEEEDDPGQEEEVVVAGDHVLGAQPDERAHVGTLVLLQEGGIPFIDPMACHVGGQGEDEQGPQEEEQA